jgi:toxin YhaV
MESNGWRLYIHPFFEAQLDKLREQVEKTAARDPSGYTAAHPAAKLLATIRHYIIEAIPRNPNSSEFRQGKTLGPDNRHWFRAKFHGRYRLFYRFSSQQKVIIYVWVNEEQNLRNAGSKTDPYAIFKAMLEGGEPPSSFAKLLVASKELWHLP